MTGYFNAVMTKCCKNLKEFCRTQNKLVLGFTVMTNGEF